VTADKNDPGGVPAPRGQANEEETPVDTQQATPTLARVTHVRTRTTFTIPDGVNPASTYVGYHNLTDDTLRDIALDLKVRGTAFSMRSLPLRPGPEECLHLTWEENGVHFAAFGEHHAVPEATA
jgi:hypothetical protein